MSVTTAASVAASAAPTVPTAAKRNSAIYAPKDPGQGLGEHEVTAIIELKNKHPSMGQHSCARS
jgi:hypothetical protein